MMLDETGLTELHLALDARSFRFPWLRTLFSLLEGVLVSVCFVSFLASSFFFMSVWYLSAFCRPMAGKYVGPRGTGVCIQIGNWSNSDQGLTHLRLKNHI
jgi:hypothetical protein